MRGLAFFIDDGGFDVFEARFFHHFKELNFGKPQPGIGVEIARLIEAVLQQIQNDQRTTRCEDSVSGGDRSFRVLGVVERLGKDREVYRGIVNWRFFNIAKPIFQVVESVFLGEDLAKLDHLGRVVDGDDFFSPRRKELGEGSFAGTHVRYHLVVEDFEHRLGQ